MHTLVLEVLIAFGLCVVAEACFQIADRFDCRRRQPRGSSASRPRRNALSINVR